MLNDFFKWLGPSQNWQQMKMIQLFVLLGCVVIIGLALRLIFKYVYTLE